jgi:hypothetical protein
VQLSITDTLAGSAMLLGPLLVMPFVMSITDFITVAKGNVARKRYSRVGDDRSQDFAILVPIFGDIKYLCNVEFLSAYGDKVILCTTTRESQAFNEAIEEVAEAHGFQIFRSRVVLASATKPPGRLSRNLRALDKRIAKQVLTDAARDEIVRDSFDAVRATYTICLDADTVAKDDLALLVGTMKARGYDIASVRVLASREKTIIERLQGIEYRIAMDARRVYPWLTSGACTIGKTVAMKRIMHQHSLFFSGGDLEIGVLGTMMRYAVGHIPFEFYTDVPITFRAWFKQRMAWSGGSFRHAVVNGHRYLKFPWFYVYTVIIVYGLTPLRWYELAKRPSLLAIVIPIYWVLTVLAVARSFNRSVVLAPLYSLIQVMVILPLGTFVYLRMVSHSRNIGVIRLRPRHVASGRPRRPRFRLARQPALYQTSRPATELKGVRMDTSRRLTAPRPRQVLGHARRHRRVGGRWLPECQCGWVFTTDVRTRQIADRTHGFHLDRAYMAELST